MLPSAALPTVLVVDDDAYLGRSLGRVLPCTGFTMVAHARTGAEAVALARTHQPDVVMIDINLGGGDDGISVASALRADRAVPVVFMSGALDDAVISRAVSAGAFGVLSKPSRPTDIRAALLVAIERHKEDAVMREREVTLRRDSLEDALTGVSNRRGFVERAQLLLNVARRQGTTATLFVLDLDGLKTINDELGHAVGDAAIVAASEVFTSTFRAADVIGRLGGDEFAVLALNADPIALKDRLQARVDEYNTTSGAPFVLAMSIGVVESGTSEDLASLLERGDDAMYAEKRSKKSLSSPSFVVAARASRTRGRDGLDQPIS